MFVTKRIEIHNLTFNEAGNTCARLHSLQADEGVDLEITVKVCDKCKQPAPRLIGLGDREFCAPCLVGAVSGLVREGLVRLEPVFTEQAQC